MPLAIQTGPHVTHACTAHARAHSVSLTLHTGALQEMKPQSKALECRRAAGYRPHPLGVYAANHTAQEQDNKKRTASKGRKIAPSHWSAIRAICPSTWSPAIGCQKSPPKSKAPDWTPRCAGRGNGMFLDILRWIGFCL